MKNTAVSSIYTAVTLLALVILTAWGNALAMLVVSILGIAIGLLLFGRNFARGGAVVAVVACVVAFAVAFWLGRW
jgi:hypothetical protein